ncbi:hypothetical protein, partial [Aminipila sp.]|uniref:hypothetical protein n=1 Tax=Aminipila sp. TaxID=2060095 RepID=UPI0028993211
HRAHRRRRRLRHLLEAFARLHAQLGLQVVLEDYIHESLLALVLQTAVKFVAVLGMIVSVFAVGRIALGVA